MGKVVNKDPTDVRGYSLNWARELDGETISTSVWTGALNVDSSAISGTTTTCVLSGGGEGVYEMTNTITTSGSKTYEKSLTVSVVEL